MRSHHIASPIVRTLSMVQKCLYQEDFPLGEDPLDQEGVGGHV